MDLDYQLIVEHTADGSPTIYRPDIDEHYHSVKGAVAESLCVYVGAGWRFVSDSDVCNGSIVVFEVGFGSGLNAALTASEALKLKRPTAYVSVELYPVSPDLVARLGYGETQEFFDSVNQAGWGERVVINPYFTLHKLNADFLKMILPPDINVVYFDAFSPEKQPDMWSDEVFGRLYESMAPGGALTTYCAKGRVRRCLRDVGFIVERLAGPVGGKREILRAVKPV